MNKNTAILLLAIQFLALSAICAVVYSSKNSELAQAKTQLQTAESRVSSAEKRAVELSDKLTAANQTSEERSQEIARLRSQTAELEAKVAETKPKKAPERNAIRINPEDPQPAIVEGQGRGRKPIELGILDELAPDLKMMLDNMHIELPGGGGIGIGGEITINGETIKIGDVGKLGANGIKIIINDVQGLGIEEQPKRQPGQKAPKANPKPKENNEEQF